MYDVRSRWGWGLPKKQTREHNQLICDSDMGGRGSKNPKILQTSYMETPVSGYLEMTSAFCVWLAEKVQNLNLDFDVTTCFVNSLSEILFHHGPIYNCKLSSGT